MKLTYLVAAVAAIQGAIAAPTPVDDLVEIGILVKRQAPGTQLYYCHDSCGQAVAGSRRAGFCSRPAWLYNYSQCLSCAGPANFNIWHYYSATLTAAASTCGSGFPTTPGGAPAPTIGPAMPDGGTWP